MDNPAVNNTCYFLLLIVFVTIFCRGVSAEDQPLACFEQHGNGTVDYSIFRVCTDGGHCCGEKKLECCHTKDTGAQWDNPYWVTKLALKISLLILAIGSGIGFCYKKCSCSKEPEILVFVNHSIDANEANFGPAPNHAYPPPYHSGAAGQFPNPATNMAPKMAPSMAPSMAPNYGFAPSMQHMAAVNSFNPYSTNVPQGSDLNTQKPPNNPQIPSGATAPHDSSILNKQCANFI